FRLCVVFFSGRGRQTRSKRDWSSDVCSSDLEWTFIRGGEPSIEEPIYQYPSIAYAAQVLAVVNLGLARAALDEISKMAGAGSIKIGRASCRERVGAPAVERGRQSK